MKLHNKNIIITGAANGIGKALAERFASEKPNSISLLDINPDVHTVAEQLDADSYVADVKDEKSFMDVLDKIISKEKSIDLFCSNAGTQQFGSIDITSDEWQATWEVNVMSHVHAAKVLIPHMLNNSGGYFLLTVSAAGLLNMPGALSYATTKHAALGLAENLSIMYGSKGIIVSALCPQLVDTEMVRKVKILDENHPLMKDGVLPAEVIAEETVQGIDREKFLILPHKEVLKYIQGKAMDYDAWLDAVRKLVP